MLIIRAKFIRGAEVKYISHLDLIKVFDRATRRAGLPIAYSQGYNPHPQMVFGLPLSVGVTSEAEYADFELDGNISPEEFMKRLNDQLPDGLRLIVAAEKLSKQNIMATIARASYEVIINAGMEQKELSILEAVKTLLKMPEAIVKKEGKNGSRDVNIMPMIHKLEASVMPDGKILLSAELGAGSVANLKPELVVTALSNLIERPLKVAGIHRTGLKVDIGGKLLEPIDAVR